MLHRKFIVAVALAVCSSAFAQNPWTFTPRVELRANFRDSKAERHPLRFTFPALPPGATQGALETPDPGQHFDFSVGSIQLDATRGDWLQLRAKVHVQDLYRRNPTSSDRRIDADELFVRFGQRPEFLERPSGTSFFVQAGKAPKMERQPIRLLESYGLAATSFNRFEDVQLQLGGTIGRSFYWRALVANGNPLFFRDANALAGDNGTPELRERPNVNPKYGSGFPILYNAETEDLFFDFDYVQYGQGLGYRWAREDGTAGFDLILFHYKRELAPEQNLTGTFYGADIDLLDGVGRGLRLEGNRKEEYGGRLYSEWGGATAIAQFTKQHIAGLNREGWEVEAGYRFPLALGWLESIQPAVRLSGIRNRFAGNGVQHPSPSIWWSWEKYDAGVRIGFRHNIDLTAEYTRHIVDSPNDITLPETLVTLRWRM